MNKEWYLVKGSFTFFFKLRVDFHESGPEKGVAFDRYGNKSSKFLKKKSSPEKGVVPHKDGL